jgi:undecaprenyl diphosphate synthase
MTPFHVAITMDGNGRWAELRGLSRTEGHRRGAFAVRRIVEAAAESGVTTLTLYAFSANNWRRPKAEVLALMTIFDQYLREVGPECLKHDMRFSLVGRRDRLPPSVRRQADHLEQTTVSGRRLHLRLAIDYSARDAIWSAADRLIATGLRSRREFDRAVRSGYGRPSDTPDVDLLIRTGGEQRLSDFLLWESAYAELWFTDVLWPDFGPSHLTVAIAAFARRERRFGRLPIGTGDGVSV